MERSREEKVIISCDVVDDVSLVKVLKNTRAKKEIVGYCVNPMLALSFGLPHIINLLRQHIYENHIVIYDHQSGATDLPNNADRFASVLRDSGIQGAVCFPLAGPDTAKAWIDALRLKELKVFLKCERVSYTIQPAFIDMIGLAIWNGVRDFILPNNSHNKEYFRKIIREMCDNPRFYIIKSKAK